MEELSSQCQSVLLISDVTLLHSLLSRFLLESLRTKILHLLKFFGAKK